MAHAVLPPTVDARRDRALRALLVLYVASALVVAVQRTVLSRENNFVILRSAFDHLIAGQDMYAAYPSLHADFFKYSPTFAFLFAPFALLPVVPGYMLWAATCALAVYAGVVRLLPPRQAALALALSWISVVGDLQRSQSNALCAGLMILGTAAFERQGQWRASAAIATGAFVKLFPLAAAAGALFHPRRLRFAGVFAAVTAVGAALPLLVVTPASLVMQYRSWYGIETRDTAPLARYGAGGADLYAGLMGQFRVWWGVEWPHWPTQFVGLALLLLPLAWQRRRWSEQAFRVQFLASTLVFCVLFNHQAESPSYAIAMIGTCVWFAASERAWWRTALLVCAVVVVNLGSTDLMPRALYHGYYVKYLLKTLPLIPVWVVMQGELLGLIPNGGRSDQGEAGERDVGASEALAHRG
jgi:hypothetical protein